MRALIFCTVVFAIAALASSRPQDKYTTKYDNVDLDEILSNKRLLTNYFNCLLEKGNCSPDATELKKSLPDALETDCSKCSEKQQNGSRKVLLYMIKNEPDMFAEVEKKYDPSGAYKKKICARAKEEKLDVGTACD